MRLTVITETISIVLQGKVLRLLLLCAFVGTVSACSPDSASDAKTVAGAGQPDKGQSDEITLQHPQSGNSAPETAKVVRSPEEVASTRRLAELAIALRTQFGEDYSQVLAQYATSSARATFEEITEEVWIAHPAVVGWSYFASASVAVIANENGAQPIIAYYQPWSDLFLITAWDFLDGRPLLVDVGLVPGDSVRRPDAELPNPAPMWLTSESFPPAALGVSIGESINALLTSFRAGTTLSQWRTQLGVVANVDSASDLFSAIAAHSLSMNLINIDNFWFTSPDEDAELAQLREAVIERMATAIDQGLAPLLAEAQDTEPYVEPVIQNISREQIARLEVVYYFRAQGEALVFLTPSDGQYFSLSLQMHNRNGQWQATRIDAVPYLLMVNGLGL